MVDQHPQSTPPAGLADAFVQAASELALSIRDLASAVRETAAFTQVELVPCEDGECDDEDPRYTTTGTTTGAVEIGTADCDRIRERDSVVLPLVPVQDRKRSGESLCQPGGCSCNEPGDGRHARREDTGTERVGDRPAGCCQGAGAGTR